MTHGVWLDNNGGIGASADSFYEYLLKGLDVCWVVLQGNPMAYLVESAGGRAITDEGPVLDIVPTSIHERCPIFLGSRADIEELEALLHAKA